MEQIIPVKTSGRLVELASSVKRPSLKEVLSLSARKALTPQITGDFQLTHRDKKTGKLVRRIAEHNIPTWHLQHLWSLGATIGNLEVCISNDDVDMHPRRNLIRATFEGGAAAITQLGTKIKDYSSRTWTYNAVFAAPSTETREINFVGLGVHDAVTGGGNGYIVGGLVTGKKLTSTEYQTTGNIVEIIYRLTLTKG